MNRLTIMLKLRPDIFRYLVQRRMLNTFIDRTLAQVKKDKLIKESNDMFGNRYIDAFMCFEWESTKEGIEFWFDLFNTYLHRKYSNHDIKYRANYRLVNSTRHQLICNTDRRLLSVLIKHRILNKVVDNVLKEERIIFADLYLFNSNYDLAKVDYLAWFSYSATKEGFFYWSKLLPEIYKEYLLKR